MGVRSKEVRDEGCLDPVLVPRVLTSVGPVQGAAGTGVAVAVEMVRGVTPTREEVAGARRVVAVAGPVAVTDYGRLHLPFPDPLHPSKHYVPTPPCPPP